MTVPYEKLESSHFRIQRVGGTEAIEVTPQRFSIATLFLALWFAGWTLAGVTMTSRAIGKPLNALVVAWLCFWAVAWVYVALLLAWRCGGVQTLAVRNGDLEITYRLLGYSIPRRYRGGDIRTLESNAGYLYPSNRFVAGLQALPFMKANRIGCIKFGYGARTIFAGGDLDEAEGREIAAWLLKRLPSTAGPQAA